MKKNEMQSNGLTSDNNSRIGPRRSLRKCDKGLSTVEYVLLLVLVAVGCIVAWQTFREQLTGKLSDAGGTIQSMQ